MAEPFYWTKKLGPRHIGGRHTTLCGKPMLGNNHHKYRPDAPPCEECEEKQRALQGQRKAR